MAYFTIEGYNSYSGCDITVTASLPTINGEAVNKYYSLGSLQTLSISTHQDKRPVRSLGVINAKDYVMGPRTIAGSMVFAVFNKHFATEIMNDLGAGTGTQVILPDEIPALNITINFANEYGRMSRMAIYGVKILNEGQVMSINDLYTENTYQFVALGLEPLNINISSSGEDGANDIKISDVNGELIPGTLPPTGSEALYNVPTLKNRVLNYGYIGNDVVLLDTTNSTSALLNNSDFLNNSGSNISEQIQNNTGIDKEASLELNVQNKYNPIILSVEVEQPIGTNDLGIATFTLEPGQSQGTIYIYPPNSNNPNLEYTINVYDKKTLIISLPVGKYQAQYINVTSDTSNTVDFAIEKYVESSSSVEFNSYPMIEKVTNKSITITIPDYSHDTVTCFEDGKSANIITVNNRVAKIDNLNPDTEYNIFTSNSSGSRSQIISVKTYTQDNEELLILQDFISTNKNMLIAFDSDDDNIFNDIDYNKYNTLIDMVLDLPESNMKQELLIYTTELANQLLTSHNIDNEVHIVERLQETPFSSTFSLKDFNIANVYINNNNRLTIDTKLDSVNNVFCGKPNRHYTIQCITDNGSRSVKKSFTICKNSSYTELERYCDVDRYKTIDLSDYISQYRLYNYNTIEYLAIRDSFHSDINLLEPPYIYQSETGDIYADINYLNLKKYERYYLCCTELYSALDYKPVRKIKFSLDTVTDSLDLKRYYLGLIPDKQYLFWIENSQFVKVSKPYLYIDNSRIEYKDLKQIYKTDLYSKLLSLRKEMIRVYGNKSVINDLFDYVYSLEPAQKNLNTVIISELINSLSNSYYVSNSLVPLFELMKIIHNSNRIINLPEITIDKDNRTVKFQELKNYHICAITYNESANEAERIIEDDTENMVEYGKEGFTMIYLVSHNMLYKTGFILIDNVNNRYRCTSDLIDLVKEVGDK